MYGIIIQQQPSLPTTSSECVVNFRPLCCMGFFFKSYRKVKKSTAKLELDVFRHFFSMAEGERSQPVEKKLRFQKICLKKI
jgi:hypothetical protein